MQADALLDGPTVQPGANCALLGMPLALKDLFDMAGIRTTAGSKFFAEHIPGGRCAKRC